MTPQIKEFCLSNNPWRIDWLGFVDRQGTPGAPLVIAVYLAELRPDFTKALARESLATPERHEVVFIRVGFIVLLQIGSVWTNGIRIHTPERLPELEGDVTSDMFELVRFDESIDVAGQMAQPLAANRYRIGARASREVGGSWLAIAKNFPNSRRACFLAIPSTVLFQRCFATSPRAVEHLLYGEMDKIVDPAGCGRVEWEQSTYKITLHKGFDDDEGKPLANIRADDVARDEYARLRSSLVASSVNHGRLDPEQHPGQSNHLDRLRGRETARPHMKMSLPFSNGVHLSVVGKALKFDVERGGKVMTQWGFLATQIIDLTTDLVFDNLIVERKNNSLQGENAGQEDLEPAWGGKPQKAEAGEDVLPVTSQIDPARNLEAAALKAAGGFNTPNLKWIDRDKDVQRYASAKLISDDGEPFSGVGGTGEPSGNTSGVAPVDVQVEQAPAVPVTLDHLMDALQHLKTMGLRFNTLAITDIHRRRAHDGHVVNFFHARDRRKRSWRRLSKTGHGPTRGFVVAEAYSGSVWHYLVDIEHKHPGELSMLYLRAETGERINPRHFDFFMEDVAKANGWSCRDTYIPQWRFHLVPHSQQRGAEPLAMAIARAVLHTPRNQNWPWQAPVSQHRSAGGDGN